MTLTLSNVTVEVQSDTTDTEHAAAAPVVYSFSIPGTPLRHRHCPDLMAVLFLVDKKPKREKA